MDDISKKVTADDLAQAFSSAQAIDTQPSDEKESKTPKPKKSKKLGWSVAVFVVGILVLICGIVFLVLDFLKVPDLADGDYLVSADEWILNDGTNCANAESLETNCLPSVIWKFTEIGKGSLTTNGHVNDYDFVWAIKDGKLLIETNWLYDLENEYEYQLDQREGTLTLKDGEKEIVFTGQFTDKQ